MRKILELLWNKFVIWYKGVYVGKNIVINGRIYIRGKNNRVYIGDNCYINTGMKYNPVFGGTYTQLVCYDEGSIKIGKHVGMSHVNIVSCDQILIENDVMIGSGTKIWDTDFHSLDFEIRNMEPQIKQGVRTAPVVIKKGAFIGAGSIILKGVVIGEKAVIGAGSVVTCDIPSSEIWGGNPAKFIRKLS